ncbi:hypothetical protein N431DRAFT_399726 [Stipitochalara longipes BDJ]|nr:hypothetical protein N431DRAFT_399726 [Stipitochalara longipes BDJ]
MSSIHTADIPDPTWPETWPRTADEIHVFDIQGDVLLKLVRHPIDIEDESQCSSVAGEDIPQVEEVFDETPPASVEIPDADPTPAPPSPPAEEPAPAVQEPDENAIPDDASIHSNDSASSTSSADILTDVHMRVSSKHLILASPTFRSMLGPNFEEGQRLRIEGSTDIALGDDDPDAFEILLNIIHGLTRRVPRSVSLDMLTRIAVLVNYYQMHEAVELFSDTWINTLAREGLPQSYSMETIKWLLISWVFHKPMEFQAVSRVIELGCDEALEDDFDESLPVPSSITTTMLAHRAAAIENAILIVHNLITRYSGPNILCPVVWDESDKLACDSLLLGSLIKGSAAIGIYPRINAPYHGVVFKDLAAQIRELKVFDVLHDVCNNGLGRYQSSSDSHGVKSSIEASMNALECAMIGLNLEDFLPQIM